MCGGQGIIRQILQKAQQVSDIMLAAGQIGTDILAMGQLPPKDGIASLWCDKGQPQPLPHAGMDGQPKVLMRVSESRTYAGGQWAKP